MEIHEISINRPITVLMCVLIVLVLGTVSFFRVPIDLIPNINIPIAIVFTSYSGAGPEEVENIITKNIENAVATVNNIKGIQSYSSQGTSIVIAEFTSNTDMDFATLQMREKVDMIKVMLPSDIESPMVMKIDPSMMPVLNLTVIGKMDEFELKKIADDKVKPRLERLDGIASVSNSGGKTREIKVEVNPDKVSGYGIQLNQVISSLQMENLNQPGGSAKYGDKDLLIRTVGEFKTLDDIKNIPIILPTGGIIYLHDIANIYDDYKTTNSYIRANDESSIGVVIQKQPSANTVKVVNSVKDEIKKLEAENPDIKINVLFDQGAYIEKSINNVAVNAVVGAGLAIIILLVFLKSLRTTFVIGAAIPISIISTFVLIYFSGITLNLVSLGGLALGVGMLVDNAIVVLENIFRFSKNGYRPKDAARLGTHEVSQAVIASTLTTVAVFLPVVFTEGIAAQVFKELALTVSFSLLASLIVALTLVPMLCSKMLKEDRSGISSKSRFLSNIADKTDKILKSINESYRNMLVWVLHHRKIVIISTVIIFISSMFLIILVGAEFFPAMDQGQFTVSINMPDSTLLDKTDEVTRKVEKMILDIPDVDMVFVSVGSSGEINISGGETGDSALINVTLKPLNQRRSSTSQIVEDLRKKVSVIPGAEIKVSEAGMTMSYLSGAPISLQIKGPDIQILEEISKEVEIILNEIEGTRQVESSISASRPEACIYVNRNRASYYGLGTVQVASLIRTAVQGSVATRYRVGGEEIDILVRLPKDHINTYEQLKSIKILSPMGIEIPLSDVAEIKIEDGPITINRSNQQRYVTVSSQIFGRDIASIMRDTNEKIQSLSLPSDYSIEFVGEVEEMQEAFKSLGQALLLAIVLVYMIMAAQFESLLHPFVIMFSVPLAYTGSLIGLALAGVALSVPSLLGVIMLAGIVVNNGIVLIDYINQLRQQGISRHDAIMQAGPTRLRPILMTTLTTILGLVPLSLGIGEGSEMQVPMAVVVIGGLISSTILTLLIMPVIYTLFDDIAMRRNKKMKAAVSEQISM